MSLPLKLDFSNYDKFLTDPNYTTSAEAQDYFRNMDMLVEALIDVGLWQPETNYPNGHVVFSPNMPNGTEAVCVATTGGKSSNTEPSWGEVGGDNVSDGTCFWKLRWKHWSKDGYAMADYPLRNTAYSLNAIVACPYHAKFMLKCTQAGTTSAGSLDTTSATLGKVYTDGGVKWEVINDFEDRQIKTYTSLAKLGLAQNCTLKDIAKTLPVNSILKIYVSAVNNPNLDIVNTGVLTATKYDSTANSCSFVYEIAFASLEVRYCQYFGWSDILSAWRQIGFSTIGEIIAFAGSENPTGYLPCDGAAVSRTTYANLFAVIGTTYGAGNGRTTFNLPNLNNGSFLEGSETAGIIKEAGLPNVSAKLKSYNLATFLSGEGAFYVDNEWNGIGGSNSSGKAQLNANLDASLSSDVYGKSDTVQPKSVTVRYYIKY